MNQKTTYCVREAVENIEDLQNAVEEDCPTGCYSNLLSPAYTLGNTVPFAIFTSKSKPFTAFGNVGELDNGPCFNTVFSELKGSVTAVPH